MVSGTGVYTFTSLRHDLTKYLLIRLGVKRVTEPNRTEPPDYTGQSLRKFPIVAVLGFTAVTERNQRMRYISSLLATYYLI